MSEKRIVGVPDIPIKDFYQDKDGLNMFDYANALTKFIESTETPMTIGIQGDWGSGKTSLLNLIRINVEKIFPYVWVNTWKYAQAESGEGLPIAVLFGIISQLRSMIPSEKHKGTFEKFGKAALNIVGKAVESQVGVNFADALKKDDIDTIFERYQAIEKLKEDLQEIVKAAVVDSQKVKGDRSDRVVIFVDDLDRIQPARAIEILEIFKVFLDVDKAVFILACDYEVVMQGLQEKFGFKAQEISGRSFFDKIIQVPFQMPTHGSDKIRSYLKGLLNRVEAKYSEDDIGAMINVLTLSTGTNPRTIKRLINILNLLLIVLDEEKHSFDDQVGNKSMIVFSLMALQNAFPEVYTFLSQKEGESLFEHLTTEDFESDPFLKRAISKNKDLSPERVNDILEILKKAVNGNGDLLIKFIRVSDIVKVEGSAGSKKVTYSQDEISDFAKAIGQKVSESKFEYVPDSKSNWALIDGNLRYYSFWYKERDRNAGVYFIYVDPQTTESTIHWQAVWKELTKRGIKEEDARDIMKKIKEDLKKYKFEIINDSKLIWIKSSESVKGYSDVSKNDLTNSIIELIQALEPELRNAEKKN